MPQKARNIALALAVLFLLPASLLTFRELRSLNQFEAGLESVYKRELDAVLYSVNQYSQDLADSWARKLELKPEPDSLFFKAHPAISQVITWPNSEQGQPRLSGPGKAVNAKEATLFLARETKTLKRLSGYLDANYRKLEPVSFGKDNNHQGLLFLLADDTEKAIPCLLGLDTDAFVNLELLPRLELLAEEDFNLFVWKDGLPEPVCATDTVTGVEILEQKPLWLLPNHRMAISLRGENLKTLVDQRSQGTISLVIGLNILVLVGVFWIFRTIRKEMQLAQTKSDFVSNVSHEIRTPLSLISMFSETLMLKRVPDEARKETYYRIIFQESKRLTSLVNKILNFSQMEAGQRAYQFSRLDLNALAEEVWEVYDFHLEQQGFSRFCDLHPEPLFIEADKEAVSEAIVNLLDNAVKYSPETRSIRLSTGLRDGKPCLSVEDQGMGIPPDQREKIFEKFHRIASGPIHNTKGTGLGLTLVRAIMDAHRGQVAVQSKEGKGSIFWLIFPQNDVN